MVAFIGEAAIDRISEYLDINAAVAAAYIAAAAGDVFSAPVLRVSSDHGGGNFKFAATEELVGGKLGTYWPANGRIGLENHAATTLLLDPRTGYLQAVISARKLNRIRTAAGNAVAVKALSREDASVLAVIGGGGQAPYEAEAIAGVRRIKTVFIGLRDPAKGSVVADRLSKSIPDVKICGIEEAVRAADIVTTATPSREPIVRAEWVKSGTHISAMGADMVGKQELSPALFDRAELFTDLESQSRVIGEFQHANANRHLIHIGDVISGKAPGRENSQQITIFDSSGLAVQDLFAARSALALARQHGLTIELDQ